MHSFHCSQFKEKEKSEYRFEIAAQGGEIMSYLYHNWLQEIAIIYNYVRKFFDLSEEDGTFHIRMKFH